MELVPVGRKALALGGFEAVSVGIAQLAHVRASSAIRRQGAITALADHISQPGEATPIQQFKS